MFIYDYTFSGLNDALAPLAPQDTIQFGTTFKLLLRQTLTVEPAYVPVFLLKVDLSNS